MTRCWPRRKHCLCISHGAYSEYGYSAVSIISRTLLISRELHRYLDNVIVFARLEAVRGPVADNQARSALDHHHKGFGRHAGVGVQNAKSVKTRLPKLDIGGELARLVGFGG